MVALTSALGIGRIGRLMGSLDGLERAYSAVVLGLLIAGPLLFAPVIPAELWKEGTFELLASFIIFVVPCVLSAAAAIKALDLYTQEQRALEVVLAKVNDDRRLMETRPDALDTVDISPTRYLPRWSEKMVSERLVELLFKNARALRRDSDLTTQVFLRELTPPRTALRPWQTVALRLGILFTFIGLLFGLQPLATSMTTGENLNTSALIQGLTISFATSIAGLSAALVIQFMIVAVDHRFTKLSTVLQTTWMDLGDLLSRMRFEGNLTVTVDRLNKMIVDHRDELAVHGRSVRDQVDRMVESTGTQGQRLQEVVENLATPFNELEALELRHRQQVDRLASAMSDVELYEENWTRQFTTLMEETVTRQELMSTTYNERVQRAITELSTSMMNDRSSLDAAVIALSKGLDRLHTLAEDDRERIQSREDQLFTAVEALTRAAERMEFDDTEIANTTGWQLLWLVPIGLLLAPLVAWLNSGQLPWIAKYLLALWRQ